MCYSRRTSETLQFHCLTLLVPKHSICVSLVLSYGGFELLSPSSTASSLSRLQTESKDIWVSEDPGTKSGLTLSSCESIDKSLHLSGPQAPHL